MLHSAWGFPYSFKPTIVSTILDRLSLDEGEAVLDPFCGAGTTLLECKLSGIPSIGIDSNPVCVAVSKAKTDWAISPSTIKRLSDQVLCSTARKYRNYLERKECLPQRDPIFKNSRAGQYLISSGLLERGWINPLAALKTLLIMESLEELPARIRNFLQMAVLGLLVPEISNMAYGPEIYKRKQPRDPDVFGLFRDRVMENLEKLKKLRSLRIQSNATVLLGDSVGAGLASVDLGMVRTVISSPPYLSDHDYTRQTRLELVLSGHVTSDEDLRKLKKTFLRSSSKNVYKEDQLTRHVMRFPEVRTLIDDITQKAAQRTSGFARVYPKLIGEYFGGMYQHFESLGKALRPGSKIAYILGDQSSFFATRIPTARIIVRLAEGCGAGIRCLEMEPIKEMRGTRGRVNWSNKEWLLTFEKKGSGS